VEKKSKDKIIKPINRYVPEKALYEIDRTQYKNKEHLYIICDMIYRCSIYKKENDHKFNSFIDIPSKYFRDIISKQSSIQEAKDFLITNNIIECDGKCSKIGGKAYGYRFNENYISLLKQVKIIKPTLTKSICSNKNDRNSLVNENLKIYKSFFLYSFGINYSKSLTYITNILNTSLCSNILLKDRLNFIEKWNYYFISISAINDGDLFFRSNKTNGRVDTNLTNLKSELKQFITTPNLIQLDIRNSQPYLLSLLIPNTTPDIDKFKLWTSKGLFYDNYQREFLNKTGKILTRKEIKDIMFCILYSKNGSYKKEKELFKQFFPSVLSFTESQKNDKHNKLAIDLQLMESEICINIICQELDKNNIKYYTIHDSWIVDRMDEIKTKDIIEYCFMKKFNNIPKLQVEKIN
jgi:hypothetical protein